MNFFLWLEQTTPSAWIREAPTLWGFPFILFLHTVGLGVVAGFSVALNVWALAFAARYPVGPMKPYFSVVWIGFTLALVSGLLLLLAYPTKALTDPVFYVKLGLVAAALFQLQRLRRVVFAAVPSDRLQPSRALRWSSGAAITAWFGAVVTGRLLAYTYNYLTANDWVGY